MEVRFIDCCCTLCRTGKEDECPYIEQFGEWHTVSLHLMGAGAKKKKKPALRNDDDIPCSACKKKGE
jgi:RecJ-like exonuclease